jgi:hypothetical protein
MGAAAIPAIILGVSAVSAGLGVVGAIQEGQAAQDQSNYQSQVAKNNVLIAEQRAADALHRGEIAERQNKLKTHMAVASSRANAASRGVLVDEGSALTISQDLAEAGRMDDLTIRNNAAREAHAYRLEGQGFQSQADLFRASGENAKSVSQLDAMQSLIGGATSVSSKWYAFNRQGAF